MKKTPLQQLIVIIKSSKQEVDVQGIGVCEVLDYHGIEDKAIVLLEEEKEAIVDACDHNKGVNGWSDGLEYYKETYQNN